MIIHGLKEHRLYVARHSMLARDLRKNDVFFLLRVAQVWHSCGLDLAHVDALLRNSIRTIKFSCDPSHISLEDHIAQFIVQVNP